jgi:UDP-glucose 4-epimerase
LAALKNGVWGSSKPCDEYNLGTGNGTSVLELLRAVESAAGKKLEYK